MLYAQSTAIGLIRAIQDRYSMLYAQSTAKGHIRAIQNVFLPQVQILIHYSVQLSLLIFLKFWVNKAE